MRNLHKFKTHTSSIEKNSQSRHQIENVQMQIFQKRSKIFWTLGNLKRDLLFETKGEGYK